MNTKVTKEDREERMRKTIAVHLSMEVKQSIKRAVDDFHALPENIFYFYERLEAYFNEKDKSLENSNVIASTCIYVPDELIYAVGMMPLRLCNGSYAMDQAGAGYMPSKSCPVAKSTLGTINLEHYPFGAKPRLIINAATCDQKKKLPELNQNESIEIHTLGVPASKDLEADRLYWYQNIKKLSQKLEKVSGKKITKKNLKDAISKVSAAQYQFRRLYEIRKKGPVIWGKDAIAIINTYFFDNIEAWTLQLSKLNDELLRRLENKQFVVNEFAPKILLTGSPSIFPNLKLPVLAEQLGGIVVADEFCSSNRMLYDTVAVDEWNLYDMVPAIADRYLKPCTCPNLTPNTDRERKLLETIREFSADGVIYQAFSGCQLYEMESYKISKLLEKEGIPMLYLETDYSPDDEGQLSTRVEAFLESIKAKKIQRGRS